uniref:Transposase Tc1-like domain-containing protein n=1 Tax=Globodera rostochiensis TaxID=31243 RepID=A0A914GZ22_GLORO
MVKQIGLLLHNLEEERIALREIQLDPTKSATDLVNCVATKFDKSISTRTGRRLLNSAQLFAHRPAYKPLLSKKNRLARLDFARSYVNHTPQQWSTVLFSDFLSSS